MVGEAIGPRRGEIRTYDLRIVFGQELSELKYVDIVVIAEEGTALTARIALTTECFGRALRQAFVCPRCAKPRQLLLARQGKIQCSTCNRRRTRRQMERHLASWNRMGGRDEDAILRMVVPPLKPTPMRLHLASQMVRHLLEADYTRVARLREELGALMTVARTVE